MIHVQEGTQTYKFEIFFKRHCRLRPNSSVKGAMLRGDALVMKIGRFDRYVNMGGRDPVVANWAIKE